MLLHRFNNNEFWSSIKEMENVRQKLNQLLQTDGVSSEATSFPLVNIWISEDAAVVTAEIPGVEAETLDISVVNDTLTITGSREAECSAENETCHRQERGSGRFGRSMKLPFTIEADKVQANFSRGVLKVTLPRAEAERPRKIAIKST